MIIWGGDGALTTGAMFNPSINVWSNTTTISAPIARANHTVVWTGTEMIIWGGYNGINFFNTGGRYKAD